MNELKAVAKRKVCTAPLHSEHEGESEGRNVVKGWAAMWLHTAEYPATPYTDCTDTRLLLLHLLLRFFPSGTHSRYPSTGSAEGCDEARPARPEYATRGGGGGGTTRFHFLPFSLSSSDTTRAVIQRGSRWFSVCTKSNGGPLLTTQNAALLSVQNGCGKRSDRDQRCTTTDWRRISSAWFGDGRANER